MELDESLLDQLAEPLLAQCRGPGINSEDRAWCLLRALDQPGIPHEVFWHTFKQVFQVCDDTWHARNDLLRLLRRRRRRPPVKLTFPLTIYRGGDATRLMGISWTTDFEIAKGFARGHRGIRNNKPAVAEASALRSDVFCENDDRNEREIIIDPRRIELKEIWDFNYVEPAKEMESVQ
jgi:hypothetical protein